MIKWSTFSIQCNWQAKMDFFSPTPLSMCEADRPLYLLKGTAGTSSSTNSKHIQDENGRSKNSMYATVVCLPLMTQIIKVLFPALVVLA